MKIVINDANILIDIVKLNLLEAFAALNFELYTTDFVFAELNKDQQIPISILHNKKELVIIETSNLVDFQGIYDLLIQTNGLSFEDCSVWYYSKKMSGILLTGDNKLRKHASKEGIEVRGIIYVFDEFVRQKLLTPSHAAAKIKTLLSINKRLPIKEINRRIELWDKK